MRKKKIKVIAYLAADAFSKRDEIKKAKQLKYIREYARAHNLQIVKIVNVSYLGKTMRREQIKKISNDIFCRKADAMIVTKVSVISEDIVEAYTIAGNIAAVGGKLITVNEGELFLNIKMMPVRAKRESAEGRLA